MDIKKDLEELKDLGTPKVSNKGVYKHVVWALMALQIVISIALFTKIITMDILPTHFDIILILLVIAFNVGMWFSTRKKGFAITMAALSTVITIVLVVGIVALNKIDSTIESVTQEIEYETVSMAVVVKADDAATKIEDIAGYKVGYVGNDAQAKEVMKEIDKKISTEATYSPYDNFSSLADTVLKGEEQAIIINSVYLDILGEIEGYENYATQTKVIHTVEVEVEEDVELEKIEKKEVNTKDGVFVMYMSGIDSYGSINTKSRSDVNILAVVNTNTGKIQLINTPRDYFVPLPISGGTRDKLTHAGIYGVDVSMGTLEMLYGVEVNYYFRINFSGFESVINKLGGVDVYSDVSFTDYTGKTYKKGYNHMSGSQALGFARTRKAFGSGDVQRGNNQMAVIKAVIQKMTSTDFLRNYDEVLNELSGCFQTNMPSDQIYELVKGQLANGTKWNIQSMSVTGTGSKSKTFSMPGLRSYVMIPNQNEVNTAKTLIMNTLEME